MKSNADDAFFPTPVTYRRPIGLIVLFWTLAVALVLTWEVYDAFEHARSLLESGSVTVQNKEAVQAMKNVAVRDRVLGYGGMWLLGLFGISVFSRRLGRQIERRCEAERQLQEANEGLERRVADRTAELAEANRRLGEEIDERRKAEEWLLESESRFRGFFEQGLIGMAVLSPDREWIETNDRLCRMLGYTQDELAVTSWDSLTHPDDLPGEATQFQSLLKGTAGKFISEKRFIRKNKELLAVGISAQYLRKPDGSLDCVLVLVQENRNSNH